MKNFDFNQPIQELETHEEIESLIADMLDIDGDNLDLAALQQPKIFGMLQRLYNVHTKKLSKLTSMLKKVELKRHRYYTGKWTAEEYKKEPIPDSMLKGETILKTDVDKYMKVDEVIIEATEMVDAQERIVKLIEDAQKQMTSRG